MKVLFLIASVFLFITLRSVLADPSVDSQLVPKLRPQKVSALWECHQTQPAGLPSKKEISVTYTPAVEIIFDDKIESPEFDAIFAEAQAKHMDTDYFECFSDFLANLQREVNKKNPYAKDKFKSSAMAELQKKVADYGAYVYKRGAVSPIDPGGRVAGVNDKLAGDIAALTIRDCEVKERGLDLRVLAKLVAEAPNIESNVCKTVIANGYAKELTAALLDEPQCAANKRLCDKRKQQVQRVLWQLAQSGFADYDYFLSNADVLDSCFVRDWLYSDKSLKRMTEVVYDLGGRAKCKKPEVGQSFAITGNYAGVPAKYTIARGKDRKDENGKAYPRYQAAIQLEFTDKDGKPNADLQKKFTEKSRQCFKEINDYLRGPDGEFLELVHYVDTKGNRPAIVEPEKRNVSILEGGGRSNSGEWYEEVSCSTIIHEVLHVLGLVDLYSEEMDEDELKEVGYYGFASPPLSADGKVKERHVHDCRNVGPENSWMNNHYKRAEELGEKIKAGVKLSEKVTVLYPAEFRFITEPGCTARNKGYTSCARWAYTDSRKREKSGGYCGKLLPECTDPQKWLQ